MTIQRVLLRLRHSQRAILIFLFTLTWFLALSLWTTKKIYLFKEHQQLQSLSWVHKEIQKWHLNDDHLPKLNPMYNEKWLFYDENRLYEWQEPREVAPDPIDGPGEQGKPVVLSPGQKKEAKKTKNLHALNLVASDLMSVNRSLPDVRNKRCLDVEYQDALPQISVIIIFHNEARSALLRTIHSVINRTPKSLLKEILMVDDHSDIENLLEPLDRYMEALEVSSQIVRSKERVGLIRARLIGAERASGSVLIFLDAHVEVTKGWSLPLLSAISYDRTRVVMPVIDDIFYNDFEYEPTPDDHVRGGMDWKLFHSWISSQGQPMKIINEIDPFPTPTMIGCAFAVDREFFNEIGSYDDQMRVWGGENIEMSVRVWLCGGSLLKIPCSRVGHVYRITSPHDIPGGLREKLEVASFNTKRFAEVWLGSFKNFYYFINPGVKNIDPGNVEKRKQLAQNLQCHDFQWFLQNVYPDSSFPLDVYFLGQIKELHTKMCLDALSNRGSVGVRTCHGLGGYQTLMITNRGELRSGTQCLGQEDIPDGLALSSTSVLDVTLSPCDQSENQTWKIDNQPEAGGSQLIHQSTGFCLTVNTEKSQEMEEDENRNQLVLSYLANMVKDIGGQKILPTLQKCHRVPEVGTRSGQIWELQGSADWKNGKSKTILEGKKEALDEILFGGA